MSSTMGQITLQVPEISCNHCVMTVEETVGELPGVGAVNANESTKQVQVTYDTNRVSLSEIEAALDDAGYPVQK